MSIFPRNEKYAAITITKTQYIVLKLSRKCGWLYCCPNVFIPCYCILVLDPPKPAVDARQKHILVSRDVNLTCKATGTRISYVQWYKRARPLSMQQQAVIKELNLNGETWINTLVLKNVQINQAGWYECRVFETNEAFGFWSTAVKLNVISKRKK